MLVLESLNQKISAMKLPGIILFAGALIFTACDDTTIDTPDSLIFEIAESVDKINIDPSELPANAKGVIEDEYFETYIESAAEVQGKGYEVVMGNEDKLYFRHDGLFLRPSMRHDRHGPCGRGILVRPADLPARRDEHRGGTLPAQRRVRGRTLLWRLAHLRALGRRRGRGPLRVRRRLCS